MAPSPTDVYYGDDLSANVKHRFVCSFQPRVCGREVFIHKLHPSSPTQNVGVGEGGSEGDV